MPPAVGQTLDALDTPQLLLDLDVLDANLRRMAEGVRGRGLDLRVHFKSLKCTGLARYIDRQGLNKGFLCAKLNEAEALADAGLTDLFVANEIIGPLKINRLVELARRAKVRVCVDDAGNVADLSRAASAAGVTLGILVELDLGMSRCGVHVMEPALELAKQIVASPGLEFVGLQGYQGHLQMVKDVAERQSGSRAGISGMVATKRLIEEAGIPVPVVTGGGTGNWDDVADMEGVTELQPGSFLLMDAAYNALRPEFACSLSVLCTAISQHPGRYILDAGSKAISQDFGKPRIKGHSDDQVTRLAEEHTRVETARRDVRVGDRFEVYPAHCCATMNLHRTCLGVRKGVVEAVWPVEASGRYD